MSNFFQAPWKIKDVLTVLSVAIFALILADLTMDFSGLASYMKSLEDKACVKEFTVMGLFLLQSLIILIPLVVLVLKKYKKWDWEDFGFGKLKLSYLKDSVLGYMMYLGISFVIMTVMVFGRFKIPGYQISEPVLPIFGETSLALAIATITIVVLAPLLEEVFFRGFVLQGLVNKYGKYYGAIATALIFSALHLKFESFIPIFIMSLVLSILFIRSKSIWPCIYFHVINNTVALLIEIMIVKGVIPLDF